MQEKSNAGEIKSHVIIDFIESEAVTNHFSKPHEQRQNGLVELAIKSIIKLV